MGRSWLSRMSKRTLDAVDIAGAAAAIALFVAWVANGGSFT